MGPAVQQARPCWSGSHACVSELREKHLTPEMLGFRLASLETKPKEGYTQQKATPQKRKKNKATRKTHTHTHIRCSGICLCGGYPCLVVLKGNQRKTEASVEGLRKKGTTPISCFFRSQMGPAMCVFMCQTAASKAEARTANIGHRQLPADFHEVLFALS